ncbi:MAG: HEPN domain-containing protein [Nitrosopumilus sp.]|nr:HEPN domain-containing protein [Nitrosopumilus sp.]MDH3340521.1 HEPN domain-containing protein [Nitrosopumilus sp.]
MAKINLKKLLKRVELKSKFNFETFTGFALEDVEKGGMTSLGIQFNESDNIDFELRNVLIQNILYDFVYPEILHRVHNNELTPTYKPKLVHILLNTKPSKNKILLEKETNFLANIILKEDRPLKDKEHVNFNEIQKITKLFPRENYMGDSAHIMLLRFKNKWFAGIDLVFDRLKIKTKMKSAREFLDTADYDLKQKKWAPFVTNTWRATELMVQSFLLFRYQGGFSRKQDHETTKKLFKSFCDHGNAPSTFWDCYDKLSVMYKPASYGTGVKGDFKIKESTAREFLDIASKMLDFVNKTLETIDRNRKSSNEKVIGFW